LVIWSEPAKKSLQNIYYFIAEDSKFYAKEVVDKIVNESEKLDDFPKIGRIVPEIDEDNVRELIIYSYRMIYEINDDNINILALIHGKQSLNKEELNK
jgi:addiction module RelE/StbE family toxin